MISNINIRPKKKWLAVQEVFAGAKVEDVAKKFDIEQKYIVKWCTAAERAAKNTLRFTSEKWERPSLRDVSMAAQKAFPTQELHCINSAVCFFVAQFFGKNDVYHVYHSGVPNVTLVDFDEERLNHMKSIYPDHWTYLLGDAFEIADKLKLEGKKYDLVISDPFSEGIRPIYVAQYFPFIDLASKRLIHIAQHSMLEDASCGQESVDIKNAILNKWPELDLLEVYKRSTHDGGTFWSVFNTENRP